MAEEIVPTPAVLRRKRAVRDLLLTFNDADMTSYAGVSVVRDPASAGNNGIVPELKSTVAQTKMLAQPQGRGMPLSSSNQSRSLTNADHRYDRWLRADATIRNSNEVLTGSVVDELSQLVSKFADSPASRAGSSQRRSERSNPFLQSPFGSEAARLLADFYSACLSTSQRLAVRAIMSSVDDLLHRGRFVVCDDILRGADVARLSVEAMLATLTITLAAREQLQNRESFRTKVASELRNRGRADVPALLSGL